MSMRDDEELEWEERRYREERDEELRQERREEEEERLQQSADDYERQMREMQGWDDEDEDGAVRLRQQEAERLGQAKMTCGMPMIIQFDPAAIKNLKRTPPPLSQDLARFGAKAVIAGVVGLGAAVAFHYIIRA
jgi:hypothetical protein